MTNRLTKLSRTTYTPGIPYQPAIPARCYSSPYTTTVYTQIGDITAANYINGKLVLTPAQTKLYKKANLIVKSIAHDLSNPLVAAPYVTFYSVYTATLYNTVCWPAYPAVPGRAAVYTVDNQRGWTAGGRSRAALVGNVVAEFTFSPVPTGVICGLASGGVSTDIGAVEHGVYASVGLLNIIESGVVVATVPGVTPDSIPRVRISRSGTVVTYSVGNWQYRSAKPSNGPKTLQASLYVAGDYVDSPRLYVASDLSGTGVAGVVGGLSQMLLSGAGRVGVAGQGFIESSATDRSLRGEGRVGVTAAADLGAYVALGGTGVVGVVALDGGQVSGSVRFGVRASGSDRAVGQGVAKIPALTVRAYGGFPTVNVGGGQITIPVYTGGDSKTGGIGGGAVALPALVLLGSDRVYAEGRVQLPAVESQGFSSPFTNEITTATQVSVGDYYFFQPTVFLMLNDGLSVGDSVELVFVFQEDMIEAFGIADNANATFILNLLIQSGLNLSNDLSQAKQDILQYATNIATGAVTRYSGFGFTSFCNVGQDLYATRQDGLYQIGGNTDNGELLSCLIDFAADDQGTARTKRLDNIFIGLTTDGRPLAKLKDDAGREIIYRLTQRDSSEARVDPAKGVSSRYWHLRLEVEGASYAEIDNIEWVAATGTRRTKR
ncbi:MAG: hypothetical protein ACOH2R_08570 [Pseudomonas sp.]